MIIKKKSKVWSKSAVEKRKKTIEKKKQQFENRNSLDNTNWILDIKDINRKTFYQQMNKILW